MKQHAYLVGLYKLRVAIIKRKTIDFPRSSLVFGVCPEKNHNGILIPSLHRRCTLSFNTTIIYGNKDLSSGRGCMCTNPIGCRCFLVAQI